VDIRTPSVHHFIVNGKQRTGRLGEAVAAEYLQKNGYRLYRRNIRLGHDEIDIVAYDPIDRTLVFAEVKTREHSHRDYTPELNYSGRKRRSLLRAARRFVASRNFAGGYRLDLLCVVNGRVIDHIKEVNNSL